MSKPAESPSHEHLLARARQALEHSYAPYSDFQVGCALLTEDGRVFAGCNIENSNFTNTICAERTAFVKAISEGPCKIITVAIVTRKSKDCWPCGQCRQFMSEFGDCDVVVDGLDGTIKVQRLSALLPKMESL